MRILSVRDIYQFPPVTWLAQHVLPTNGLGLIYGPTNVGKSFVALDLACSVASGLRWLGKRVLEGPVVYVAAGEGVPGLRARLKDGWSVARQVDLRDLPIHFVPEAVQLHVSRSAHAFMDLIADYEPSLVVFDTLARCFVGGNENGVEDMGKVIGACDEIRSRTGAAVLLVHHTGRPNDEGRVHERGSTALPSAVDTSMEVCLAPDLAVDSVPRRRVLRCRKQKDAEFFFPIEFELREVRKFGRVMSLVPHMGSDDSVGV